MGDPPSWLPTTAYAVLGLLAVGEEHTAYDLKQRADRSIAHIYWAPAMSAMYTELQRLEALGLVSHRLEAETDARSKRVYRVTPAGVHALRSWIEEGRHEPTVVKNTTLLRVLFGRLADPEVLARRVREHAAWARAELGELERALAEAEHLPGPTDDYRMPRLVLQAVTTVLRVEADAADQLAGDLAGAGGVPTSGAPRDASAPRRASTRRAPRGEGR
jgi:DNA-binding PadR family transcriptional regulator